MCKGGAFFVFVFTTSNVSIRKGKKKRFYVKVNAFFNQGKNKNKMYESGFVVNSICTAFIYYFINLWHICSLESKKVFRYSAQNKHFTTHLPTGQRGFLILKWNLNSVMKAFSPAALSAQSRAAVAPPLCSITSSPWRHVPSRPMSSGAGAMCVLFKLLKSDRVSSPTKTSTEPSDGGRRVC